MSLSNLHGRVLELCVVKEFEKVLNNKLILSEKTIQDNIRDTEKLNEIKIDKLNHFKSSSVKIVKWIIEHIGKFDSNLKLERLSDEEGKKGDVTDIRLTYDEKTLNISLKNNHLATKHQRPGPTPKHIGLTSDSEEAKHFKIQYQKINFDFFNFVKSKNQNFEKYNEVEEYKLEHLYEPICNLVSDLLNKHKQRSKDYLLFLIGNVFFKKIVLFKNYFQISSFDNIPETQRMKSWVERKNYVIVEFNDDILLSMRLHTASSRLSKGGSLKFDTQIQKMNVNKEIINL